MVELEREKTYLLKELPADLGSCRYETISDAYIPASALHPVLRLRHRGYAHELTKKEPLDGVDSSRQTEHTIKLTAEEAAAFDMVDAKRFVKRRYYCTVAGRPAELDLYQGDLAGLAVIDFEFDNDRDLDGFTMPAICLADITQEEGWAAGVLAGKTYADISAALQKYGYEPLYVEDSEETKA